MFVNKLLAGLNKPADIGWNKISLDNELNQWEKCAYFSYWKTGFVEKLFSFFRHQLICICFFFFMRESKSFIILRKVYQFHKNYIPLAVINISADFSKYIVTGWNKLSLSYQISPLEQLLYFIRKKRRSFKTFLLYLRYNFNIYVYKVLTFLINQFNFVPSSLLYLEQIKILLHFVKYFKLVNPISPVAKETL